jgi:hypothetical protein
MGKDLELIATCLQLTQVEIDKLQMENATSLNIVVHKILLTWKRKLGPTATLGMLEKSLKDAERNTGASVDWDVVSRAKDDILKERK